MKKPKHALPDLSIEAAAAEFAADLRIDKSPKTIKTYSEAILLYERFARNMGITNLSMVTPASIRAWLLELREGGRTEATLFNRYNGVRALMVWATAEGMLRENPALKVPAPRPQAKPIPVLSIDQLKAMLRATGGNGFEDVRDHAIIRLLVDTGMRRAECADLHATDLDFEQDIAIVTGKGNRVRACPFGPRTAKALRRYLRIRAGHDHATEQNLWLGRRGPLMADALLDVLKKRARQAGVEGRVFVHQLRHTWASAALAEGMQEGDVMRLGGWRDRDMLARYGSAGADQRARKAYREHSLGERL